MERKCCPEIIAKVEDIEGGKNVISGSFLPRDCLLPGLCDYEKLNQYKIIDHICTFKCAMTWKF